MTVDDIMALKPCYSRERVVELWAGRESLSLLEIMDLDISDLDRVWVGCRCLEDRSWLELAVARANARADEVVREYCTGPWAEAWLNGSDRSVESARADARAARAAWAAWAAWAARDEAAEAAAWAAAWAARAAQAAEAAAWAAAWAARAAQAAEARAAEAEAAWAARAGAEAAWAAARAARAAGAEAAWAAARAARAAKAAAWAAEVKQQVADLRSILERKHGNRD